MNDMMSCADRTRFLPHSSGPNRTHAGATR